MSCRVTRASVCISEVVLTVPDETEHSMNPLSTCTVAPPAAMRVCRMPFMRPVLRGEAGGLWVHG
eukprot:2513235-Rhodomonas_salina.1